MRAVSALVWLVAPSVSAFMLPPLASCPQQPRLARQRMAMVEDSNTDELDSNLDALVRAEVEAAFAGLEKTLDADDDEALRVIEEQGQVVMQSVLDKLEAEGQLLSSSLTSQIELLSMTKQKQATHPPCNSAPSRSPTGPLTPHPIPAAQMLADYDESTAKLQARMLEERQTIRDVRRASAEKRGAHATPRGGAYVAVACARTWPPQRCWGRARYACRSRRVHGLKHALTHEPPRRTRRKWIVSPR